MKNDEFDKLFKYMEKHLGDMDKRFDVQDAKVGDLQGAVAELSGQIRDYHQEFIMLGRKVD